MTSVLIIDDDPTTLGLLKTRLEKAGYKVRLARDGQAGLQMAQEEIPRLVFLDVRMPKLDGWQVCKALKSNPVTSQTPVIMLTGCSQDVQELYGLQCGADEYVTKPWDAEQLLNTMSQLLQRVRAAQDTRSEAFQERIRNYVQRLVRLVGSLPKSPAVEGLAGQLLQLATSFLTTYQSALTSGAQWRQVEQLSKELIYWLTLLRDSKTSDNPEVALLWAESGVLKSSLSAAAGNPPRL
jgi:CheY-like chemotaxis protein